MGKPWRERENVQFLMDTTSKCVVCGGRDRLDIHHKHPQSRPGSYEEVYGVSVHDDRNLVVVCMGCHSKYHDRLGVVPSLLLGKRRTNAVNLQELCKRYGRGFWKLAPEYITEAFIELAFKLPEVEDQCEYPTEDSELF